MNLKAGERDIPNPSHNIKQINNKFRTLYKYVFVVEPKRRKEIRKESIDIIHP